MFEGSMRCLLVNLFLLLVAAACLKAQPLEPVSFDHVGNAAPGYFLLDSPHSATAGFLDHGGKWRHTFPAFGIGGFHVQPEGSITAYVRNRDFIRYDADMKVKDTLKSDGYRTDFHDVHVYSSTRYIVLGVDERTMDLRAVVEGGKVNARVLGCVIQVRSFDGQTLFEWKSLDHIPVTDATDDVDLTAETIDYIHANSVWRDTDGNIIVSFRHLDEVVKISGTSGAIIWRLGGSRSKNNQFTWLNDERDGFTGFSHQHTAYRTSAGNLMMFDNGNLKPVHSSRAVVYKLNEQQQTVERIWEYYPSNEIATTSMGSVQELPNGNIVIGWGTNSRGALLTEVDRNGAILAQVTSPISTSRSYRVSKVAYKLLGAQVTISGVGLYRFMDESEPVGLELLVASSTTVDSVSVERHSHSVSIATTTQTEPCRFLPLRWTVRHSGVLRSGGSMVFSFNNIGGVEEDDNIVLYHRPTDGEGEWVEINGTYNSAAKTFTFPEILAGEFVAGSTVCKNPAPISPVASEQINDVSPTLVWSITAVTSDYSVQLATSTSFESKDIVLADTLTEFRVSVENLLSLTQYFWRVRAIRPDGPGPWSAIESFRTGVARPTQLYPKLFSDTASFSLDDEFLWTSSNKASSYQVQIAVEDDTTHIVADTILASTRMRHTAIRQDVRYAWRIRARAGADVSSWTTWVSFKVGLAAPKLLSPSNATSGVSTSSVAVVWSKVGGAVGYYLTVVDSTTGAVVYSSMIEQVRFKRFGGLLPGRTYLWMVRSIGRTGMGPWSSQFSFRTAFSDQLPMVDLLLPMPLDTVSKSDVELVWGALPGSSYYVEVGLDSSFDSVLVSHATADTTYLMPLPNNINFETNWWRVTATSGTGLISIANPWSFVVQPLSRPVIGLEPLEPRNGSEQVPVEGTLLFSSDSRANSYRVQMADAGGTIVMSIGILDTTVGYSGLRRGAVYRWWVVGMAGNTPIDTGSVSEFSTLSAVSDISETEPTSFIVEHGFQGIRLTHSKYQDGLVQVYNLSGSVLAVGTVGQWISLHMLPYGTYGITCSSRRDTSRSMLLWLGGGNGK